MPAFSISVSSHAFLVAPRIARWATCGAIVAVVLLWARFGVAQRYDSKRAADQLFREARLMLDSERYGPACARFQASYQLDPALGTMLNMAVCSEGMGRWERALTLYRTVETQARETGDLSRATYAREAAGKLLKRMPRLVIRAPQQPVPGLTVLRNGEPILDAQLGRLLPVDEGSHVIVATAPRHRAFAIRVTALQNAPEVKIVIDMRAVTNEQSRPSAGVRRAGHTLGTLLTSAGASIVGVGLVSGWSAYSTWNRAFDDELCSPDTRVCTQAGQERISAARTHARMSTLLVGVGAVAVGAGMAAYWLNRRRRRAHALTVTPVVTDNYFGTAVLGAF